MNSHTFFMNTKIIYIYKFILFFFLYCYNIPSFCCQQKQNINIFKNNADNENSVDSFLFSIKDSTQKAKIIINLSRKLAKKKEYYKAIEYLEKYISITNQRDKDYHLILHILGLYSMNNNQINKAIFYFKKSSKLNFYPKKTAQSLCELGRCYKFKGQFEKSLEYYVNGIKNLKKIGKINSAISHSLNLSITSYFIKNKKSKLIGIKHLKYVDSLLNVNPEFSSPIRKNLMYNSFANLYASKYLFDSKKADFFFIKAISAAKNIKNKEVLAQTFLNYGDYLVNQENELALKYLTNGLTLLNCTNSHFGLRIEADIHKNISLFYYSKRKYKESLKKINKSLIVSLKSLTPTKSELIITKSRYNILKGLNIKIQILKELYLEKKIPNYLNQIIETVNISDQLVEIILEDSTESTTQFSWRNDVSKIYNYGIYAARVLGDDDLQFQYLEKNKAFLLTQSINDNNYSSNLPNHIVNKELEYKKQILDLESKVSESKQLRDSLFDIKFNYQNFKDSIQLAYPKHFESKQKVQLTSLDKVQKSLNKNTIIVSYALQNEEIIGNISSGLLISKNKTIPFAISNIDTLQKNLNLFRKLIAKPLNTKKEINQFNRVSHFLYQNLFPTKEIQELIKGKQLTIIADNQLQNIPFEAFITDTSSNSYLIEDNDISYAYSMSFSDINNKIERTQTKDFAGFAPINFENQKLTSLEYSEKEINTISDNLNGLSLTGNSVTKDSFFKNAADARIIHLATHADISKKPVIHFSKDSLNLHELYTYKNNADLVVLSACETNLGELKKGEGILNLARGFFYSGSKSVVSSLWKVNDVATTSLMSDFYANLKNHQSKSEAINNAKRNYLKTHTLSEKSPYYWASFILIGDTTPTFESDYTIYWIIGSLLFGVLLFFLGVKTLKKKEK